MRAGVAGVPPPCAVCTSLALEATGRAPSRLPPRPAGAWRDNALLGDGARPRIRHFRRAGFTSGAGQPLRGDGAMEAGADRKVRLGPTWPVPAALGCRARLVPSGPASPRVSPQRQREEAAETSDLSGEDDDDYVPYVPVKQRKQQMVTE